MSSRFANRTVLVSGATSGIDEATARAFAEHGAQVCGLGRRREATGGRGVDVVLEMASGEVGQECLRLLAPFGRVVVFGARNMYTSISTDEMQRLIHHNQSLIGFNVPTQRPEELRACVPKLLELVASRKLQLFARSAFALDDARLAFAALESRRTIGKVVLLPRRE
jgi:NADPH2:quinone reductase